MIDIHDKMKDLASRCLRRELSMDDFRADFAALYFHARQSKDVKANNLASRIVGPLAEFSRRHRDENSLRLALEEAIFPFEENKRTYAAVLELFVGPIPPQRASSANSFECRRFAYAP